MIILVIGGRIGEWCENTPSLAEFAGLTTKFADVLPRHLTGTAVVNATLVGDISREILKNAEFLVFTSEYAFCDYLSAAGRWEHIVNSANIEIMRDFLKVCAGIGAVVVSRRDYIFRKVGVSLSIPFRYL